MHRLWVEKIALTGSGDYWDSIGGDGSDPYIKFHNITPSAKIPSYPPPLTLFDSLGTSQIGFNLGDEDEASGDGTNTNSDPLELPDMGMCIPYSTGGDEHGRSSTAGESLPSEDFLWPRSKWAWEIKGIERSRAVVAWTVTHRQSTTLIIYSNENALMKLNLLYRAMSFHSLGILRLIPIASAVRVGRTVRAMSSTHHSDISNIIDSFAESFDLKAFMRSAHAVCATHRTKFSLGSRHIPPNTIDRSRQIPPRRPWDLSMRSRMHKGGRAQGVSRMRHSILRDWCSR